MKKMLIEKITNMLQTQSEDVLLLIYELLMRIEWGHSPHFTTLLIASAYQCFA